MISKLLYVLENGAQALKIHSRFLLVIAFIFIFPLLLLYMIVQNESIALENNKTSQKAVVRIIHQSLETQLNSHSSFISTANTILDDLPSKPIALLYTRTNDGYRLATTTAVSGSDIPVFVLETAPDTGELFIFEDEASNGRTWRAVSKGEASTGEYALVTIHNYAALDKLVTDRRSGVYVVSATITVLLLLVAYWLVRQINWEHRYRTLAKKLDEQKALATTITHEFRAPLTAVAGHLSFLRESNRLRTKDLNSVSQMELSVERLQHLVNDFLEIASIQSTKLKLSIAPVQVSEVVYEVLHTLGSAAADKEIALKDKSRNEQVILQTDRDRLVQILVNVVSNAIKYSEKGDIAIVYEQNPLYVTIRIQDTGSGISADDQKKLFQPFSRVGGVDDTDITGSGLGMWITKQLVEILCGTIAVESIKGVGTHVVIKFDLRKIAKNLREGIL